MKLGLQELVTHFNLRARVFLFQDKLIHIFFFFFFRFEMLAGAQRDFTPEKAAEIIRNQSDTHYKLSPEDKK